MITWDEARKCPKCKVDGREGAKTPTTDTSGRPLTVIMLYCITPTCNWFETPWPVSMYADGTIMQPQGGREKQYVMPEGGKLAIAQRMQNIEDQIGFWEKQSRGQS